MARYSLSIIIFKDITELRFITRLAVWAHYAVLAVCIASFQDNMTAKPWAGKVHHFKCTASQSESKGPQRTFPCPVDQIIHSCQCIFGIQSRFNLKWRIWLSQARWHRLCWYRFLWGVASVITTKGQIHSSNIWLRRTLIVSAIVMKMPLCIRNNRQSAKHRNDLQTPHTKRRHAITATSASRCLIRGVQILN